MLSAEAVRRPDKNENEEFYEPRAVEIITNRSGEGKPIINPVQRSVCVLKLYLVQH